MENRINKGINEYDLSVSTLYPNSNIKKRETSGAESDIMRKMQIRQMNYRKENKSSDEIRIFLMLRVL